MAMIYCFAPRMPDSAAPSPPNLQDPVTLLLINGTTVEQAESFCVTRGMNPAEAKAIVGEARKRITVAADYARDEQIALVQNTARMPVVRGGIALLLFHGRDARATFSLVISG
jgi:hypothetical protein